MPNRNYNNGRAKEYRIIEDLRGKGYDITQRTAGSHSQIDVIAINKTTKEILLIQAKPKSLSDKKKEGIESEGDWLNGLFSVKFEVR
jgi:Holliday junction resolvase